jgi:hypothetical protein
MTVGELLDRISSEELTEWMEFAEQEPFGARMDSLGHGIVASTLANIYKKENVKPFTAEDFMPDCFKQEVEPQSVDVMRNIALMWTSVANSGKVE